MKDFDFLPLEFRKFSELLLTLLSFYQTYKCKGLKLLVKVFLKKLLSLEIFYRKIFIIICWLISTKGIAEKKSEYYSF